MSMFSECGTCHNDLECLNCLEKKLKTKLGSTYGGPSISYEDGHFVLFIWYDAPVGMEILKKSKTLDGLLKD